MGFDAGFDDGFRLGFVDTAMIQVGNGSLIGGVIDQQHVFTVIESDSEFALDSEV